MGSIVFSDSYTVSGVGYKSFKVRLSFSETYNAATNKTAVTITGVELKMEDNALNWGQLPFFGSVKVAGTTLLSMSGGSSVRVSVSGDGYNSVAIPASGTVEIAHNDDGSKSVDFTLVGGLNSYFAASYNGKAFGVGSVSRTVALTSHARASAISSYSSSVATQGSFALSVARNSSAFYHKASFKIGSATVHTSAAFAASLSYTVPRSWFANHPSDDSLDVSVSVQTYTNASCTTAVGAPAEASFTVTADAGMKPTLSSGWVTLAPYNVGAAASLTGYIKGYSRAQASFDEAKISLTDAVGASIASYSVAAQGSSDSTSPYLTSVLSSTSVSVVCTVTDSRGRSASESFTLPVMDYARPSVSGISVYRCTSNGTADELGTYYAVTASVSVSSLGGQNSATLVSQIAASGGSYGGSTALTSGTRMILGTISTEQSYTVRLTATDALGNTAVYYAAIPTRKWAMKFRPDGSGVAFGKAAEYDSSLEVSSDWTVRLGKPLPIASGGTGAASAALARNALGLGNTTGALPVANGGTGAASAASARTNLGVDTKANTLLAAWPVGSIYMSVNSTSPATLFGGTWTQLKDRFLLGAGSSYSNGATGGEATHTLTVAEMPAHTHKSRGYWQAPDSGGCTCIARSTVSTDPLDTNSLTSTGGGGAHNNMPPYLVVYMWKRTA